MYSKISNVKTRPQIFSSFKTLLNCNFFKIHGDIETIPTDRSPLNAAQTSHYFLESSSNRLGDVLDAWADQNLCLKLSKKLLWYIMHDFNWFSLGFERRFAASHNVLDTSSDDLEDDHGLWTAPNCRLKPGDKSIWNPNVSDDVWNAVISCKPSWTCLAAALKDIRMPAAWGLGDLVRSNSSDI